MKYNILKQDVDLDNLYLTYLEADDALMYYSSLKHIADRLSYSETLLESINKLFSLTCFSELDRLLNKHVFKDFLVINTCFDDPVDEAKRVNELGFGYLSIGEVLDEKTLREKRNEAALKYHPDKQGNEEIMKIVNTAYSQFKEILRQSGYKEQSRVIPPDSTNYLIRLLLIRIAITLDLYDFPRAYSFYREYRDFTSVIAQSEYQLHSLIISLLKLHRGFCLYESKEKQEEVLQDIIEYYEQVRVTIKRNRKKSTGRIDEIISSIFGVRNNELDYLSLAIDKCEENMRIKPTVVIRQEIRAKNALALGIITIKQYRNLIDRFSSKETQFNQNRHHFIELSNFIEYLVPLPFEQDSYCNTPHHKLVKWIPEPDYYMCDIRELSDDQRVEYFKGLRSKDFECTLKYYFVRLLSYIHSSVYFYSYDLVNTMRSELEFLNQTLVIVAGGSWQFYGTKVLEFLRILHNSTPYSIQETLNCIKTIIDREATTWLNKKKNEKVEVGMRNKAPTYIGRLVKYSSIEITTCATEIPIITLHPSFVKFLCMEIESMRNVILSGEHLNVLAASGKLI